MQRSQQPTASDSKLLRVGDFVAFDVASNDAEAEDDEVGPNLAVLIPCLGILEVL